MLYVGFIYICLQDNHLWNYKSITFKLMVWNLRALIGSNHIWGYVYSTIHLCVFLFTINLTETGRYFIMN
jgi:hypothetical protein